MRKILEVPEVISLYNPYGGFCCTASLCMAFSYHGFEISQLELAEQFFGGVENVRKNGVFRNDAIDCAKKLGFIAYPQYHLGLDGIIRNIERGLPIIARTASGIREIGHVCVVRGYEIGTCNYPTTIWINDPTWGKIMDKYEDFLHRWHIHGKKDMAEYYGVIIRKK